MEAETIKKNCAGALIKQPAAFSRREAGHKQALYNSLYGVQQL